MNLERHRTGSTRKQVITCRQQAYHRSQVRVIRRIQVLLQLATRQPVAETVFQLPSDSPDFNPIAFLWKKVKKQATHRQYFPDFVDLMAKVDAALRHFAQTPREITALMGCYRPSLDALAG
ncbi:MAG: hypothetical protein ACR2PL_08765 [Dehalococcoidia bacterium]